MALTVHGDISVTGDENDGNLDSGVTQLALKVQTIGRQEDSRPGQGSLVRPAACCAEIPSAVSKDAHRNLADFSSPWMDARTPASSSTTNTVGASAAVIQAPRPWWVDLKQKLAPRGSCWQPTSGHRVIR